MGEAPHVSHARDLYRFLKIIKQGLQMVEKFEVCCYQGLVRPHQTDVSGEMRMDAATTLLIESVDAYLSLMQPSNTVSKNDAAVSKQTVTAITLTKTESPLPKLGEIVTCLISVLSDKGLKPLLSAQLTGIHGKAWLATIELEVEDSGSLWKTKLGAEQLNWPPMRLIRRLQKNQCDQAGHVNVQAFMELADEAVAVLCIQSLTELPRMQVVKARISFKHELFEGDMVSVFSGIRSITSTGLDVVHGIVHQPSGRLACILETHIAVLDSIGKTKQFTEAVETFPGELINDWPSLPCAREPALPRVANLPLSNSLTSVMAVVDAWDADEFGFMNMRAIVNLCSTGARQYLATIGLTGLRFSQEKITVAAVDYLIEIYQRPRLGSNITVRSDYLSHTGKSLRFSHHFMDSNEGSIFATVEIVGVMLDLSNHRSTEIPKDVLERLLRVN